MRRFRDRHLPCLVAFRFLTRVPLPGFTEASPLEASPVVLGRSALCYPLVGLCLGMVLALLWLGLASLPGEAPALASAALLLAAWVWSTGGLHLDGLGDCADAWVGGLGSRERTLRILKDPLTGSMGVVALVLILLVKFAALASLPAGPAGALILLLTPALARAQLLALPLTTASARPDGLGAALSTTLPRRAAGLVLAMSGALALLLFASAGRGALGLALVATAGMLLFVWRRSMRARLGGFTGDTAGALVELTEAALLLVAVLYAG
ncbi:adenosylcobinamide-GDP ribazoletransferase [Halochromatium salexigens]|uniref:Adenosylcobinamide-GDP ribazoletransferase n=1 Tax=Halochromatium salexigens TaxID=49447 RepID=A0AAJ0UID3_HALSE|nr:adenosylcobinamide-GDP ribazoletransferase [Halochromatium salexigens]MBK5931310.1 adenosylcobinamide-GDP ribazoletransferase [Halochromatium salexigens]